MRRLLLLTFCCAAVAGCDRRCARIALHSPERGRPAANLVLSATPGLVAVATSGFERSDWPAVVHGYRSEETFYSSVLLDQQIQFDEYTGLLAENQIIRSGVWLP